MKITFILFLLALFINDISCNVDIGVVIMKTALKISYGSDMLVFSDKNVEMLLEAVDSTTTSVLLEILYMTKNHEVVRRETQTVQTGTRFIIPKELAALYVKIKLNALNPNYSMETSLIEIDFVPFPLKALITPDEEPAVARKLAILGKIIEITQN